MSTQPLDPLHFPLHGSRLIEASAGTGKTYTIAALYLRLILGHGNEGSAYPRALLPAEILVMTFTRAATRELSDRIRARLLAAAEGFRDDQQPSDDLIAALRADYPGEAARRHAAWRLATAAEAMDEAAVFTIDAWCQRMLREHAFDSGSAFQETLVADETELRREALHDYWRREVYPLQGDTLAQVLQCWPDVEKFVSSVEPLIDRVMPATPDETLAECISRSLEERHQRLIALAHGWVEKSQQLCAWLNEQRDQHASHWQLRLLQPGHYRKWLQQLADWAAEPTAQPLVLSETARHRLTPEGLLSIRKPDAPPFTPPVEAQQFAELLQGYEALPETQVAMRQHAAVHVARGLARLKAEQRQFGFADLLNRLESALNGPHGERLRRRILDQYPVALIDEFQDTSPQQYRLFDTLYQTEQNDPHTALLLIGDPKQSIYGFRGADIHSYLRARAATQGRHYVLGTNYRSAKPLVAAVNTWFELAEARPGPGAFGFRHQHADPLPFVSVQARGREERWVDRNGELPALEIVHDLVLRKADERRTLAAERCAERAATWLMDGHTGFEHETAGFSPLQPADIAVLVRSRTEAQYIREALHRRGIASVYLSDRDSVFASEQASDLQFWLLAVASPQDSRQVRAALATGMLGLPLNDLAELAADDTVFDRYSEQMRELHQVWRRLGVLAMLRQTLHRFDLAAHWLAQPDGERKLTNFLHLAELLQQASTTVEGELALIRWFIDECQNASAESDDQILRLESDADLVKVVTIHKSKGLEYPVVCLPFVCEHRPASRKSVHWREVTDDDGRRTTRLDLSEQHLAQADTERLQEDLRLFYVALTRARHAVWVHFQTIGSVRSKTATCETHLSAAGHLLSATALPDSGDWLAALQQLQNGDANRVMLSSAPESVPVTPFLPPQRAAALRDATPYSASFERRWTLASFSSLTRNLHRAPHLQTEARSPALFQHLRLRPAADETDPGAEILSVEPAAAIALAPAAADAPPWHRFPRGPVVGDFLHEQLEWLANEHFALIDNEAQEAALRRRCERAGHGERADELVSWFKTLLAVELPSLGTSLTKLQRLLPEMEFWLPTDHFPAQALDQLCQQHLLAGVPRAALSERDVHGMLMGFADLVFEHNGRYWVLDYKSNALGADASAYHHRALEQLMAHHRYDVQGAIYLLALHRLLAARLGAHYEPQEHLGGAIFFFIRGVDAEGHGEYALPIDTALLSLLQQLDQWLPAPGSVV